MKLRGNGMPVREVAQVFGGVQEFLKIRVLGVTGDP
jgi:hypothetical protein